MKKTIQKIFDYLDGGYNFPSDEEINKAPLTTKEKDYKPLFSESDINKAPIHIPEKSKNLYGFWNWLNGGFNTPKYKDLM